MNNLEHEQCQRRDWCDQDDRRPHRCQRCYGTWLGVSATGDARGTGVQLVIGEFDGQVRPVVVSTDSMVPGRQLDTVLTWPQFGEFMDAGAEAWARFREEG